MMHKPLIITCWFCRRSHDCLGSATATLTHCEDCVAAHPEYQRDDAYRLAVTAKRNEELRGGA